MRSRLSADAKADLADIRRFITRDNPQAAAKVIHSIRKALRKVISRFPLVGTSRDDLSPGLRCFPVGNYVIYYRAGTNVDVVRVVHGARDARAFFGR
ncbi:MAG TPA: type II toxin-antitoxin system RelE/ParE family toxin [Pirellulales bacterium]|jgi:toxin ParE1/3/4|nr:type II toxin-antitoxin system RelE/ParE family toxin [Pirellulales bacterium]